MFPTDESFTLSWTKEESLQRKHPEARVLFPFVIFFILCVFIKKAMKAARIEKGFLLTTNGMTLLMAGPFLS